MSEKCHVLDVVFSNSTWKRTKFIPHYGRPSEMIDVANTVYQKEKAVFPQKDGLFDIWFPFQDDFRTQLAVQSEELEVILTKVEELIYNYSLNVHLAGTIGFKGRVIC
jgi:hypothetical protein